MKEGIKKIIVILLLFNLHSCNSYMPGYDFSLYNGTKAQALASAVEYNNEKRISYILDKNPELVDFKEPKFGETLLMLAIANDLNESIETLLKYKANPFILDKENKNSMLIASSFMGRWYCNTEKIDLLIKYGGSFDINKAFYFRNSNAIPKVNYVTTAISYCFDVVKKVVENGADINYYNVHFHSRAVFYSLLFEKLDIAKYLIIEKRAQIPNVFSVGYYYGKPEQKVNIYEFIEQSTWNSTKHDPQILIEIIEYLKKHPEQFVSAPDSLVKLRLE